MSQQENDFSAFLSGFVVGGLIGAAVAILFAPQSGEETRTVIRTKSGELKDIAYEQAGTVRTRATEAASTARVRTEQVLDEARQKAETIGTSTKEQVTDLQKRGQVVLEEQKERLNTAIEAGKKMSKRKKGEEAAKTDEAAEDASE
jgi:gas vesicle protein